jgi:putative endonuclease
MEDQPTRMQRGQQGEEFAVGHLAAHGYRLIERNWRPGNAMRGEIDCIAWHGPILCFIEVKTRASNERGAPREAVTLSKQRQLSSLANAYVSRRRLGEVACRFDVVEVWMGNDPARARIAVHQNAFDYIPGGSTRYGRRVF